MQVDHPERHAGPRGRKRAGARARRAFVSAVTAATLALGNVPMSAFAQEPPVVVDQVALAELLFGAVVQTREGGNDRLAHMLTSAEFIEWREQNPSASHDEAADHFAERQLAISNGLRAQERALSQPDFAIRALKELMETPPSSVITSPHLRSLLDATLGKSVAAFDTREDLAEGALRAATWMRAKDEQEARIWAAVRRQALDDDVFAFAWNTVVGTPLGLDATATFDQLKGDPVLSALLDVDAILSQAASRPAFLAAARLQFGQVVNGLFSQSSAARARAVQVAANCPPGPVTSPACTDQQKQAVEVAAKAAQKEIDAAAAAAKILAGLVGLTDLKTGEKLGKIATALFSIVTAINGFALIMAESSQPAGLIELAAIGMTGNIIGAVMTLVGLLADSGPSLDQQILQQLGLLRQEVRDLHVEMRQSFQRIDARLEAIFVTMLTEFAKLGIAIAGNTAALTGIQNTLAAQGLRLETIQATILTAIGEVELHDARVYVNRYIGHLEIFGEPIPTVGEYRLAENEFQFVATEAATDTSFVILPSEATNPTVVKADLLNSRGEADAISYLARLARFRDPNFQEPADLVANPGVWNFGAQAYTLLQLQNPAYATEVEPFRVDEIVAEGQRILDAASSFSRPAPTPDPQGNRTNAVFTSLMQDYRNAVGRLSTEMALVRTRQIVVRDEPGGVGPIEKSYNLFGTADQPLSPTLVPEGPALPDPPGPNIVKRCGTFPDNPNMTRPTNVSFRVLAPQFRFALYAYSPRLGETADLPEASFCYDLTNVDIRTVPGPAWTKTTAKLKVTVHTRFRWSPAEAWRTAQSASYTFPAKVIAQICETTRCDPRNNFNHELSTQFISAWPTGKADFQQSATITESAALRTEAHTKVTAFLQGRQRALYALVAGGIRNAGTPLNRAARDMNDAARQLQAYTRLGFPIALGSDATLSSLLFGQFSLPVNMGDDLKLDATFNVAFNNYACTEPVGEACSGGVFSPLRGQPFLETLGEAPSPVVCRVPTGGPGLPGDPVGNCLVASALQRVNGLASRYRQHSQALANGVYVEQLPWVSTTMATLPLVDTMVRVPPSN
jgi:hypothetical protein